MHHTVLLLTQLPLPYISSKLRYVPYLSRAAGLRPSIPLPHQSLLTNRRSIGTNASIRPALVNMVVRFCWIILHSFFFFLRITAKVTQDTVCYWTTCRLWEKLCAMSRHLATNQWIKSLWKVYLLNKAAVCNEQSVSKSWSQEHGLERWVKLSLMFLRSYQA